MKAMAAKQPSSEFHRQHQEVIQSPVVQNVIPSTDAIMLQRKSACTCGGGCPRCEENMVRQPKLRIGEPGDRYEREADRVADEVMRMAESQVHRQAYEEEEKELLQTKPLVQQITSTLQTKELSGQTSEISQNLETHINAIRGGGQPLPTSIRAFFEPRFGYDFSQVRVHTDARAAKSARVINAKAFTKGTDVVFSAGQYSPDTVTGKRILTHELTHVVQQRNKSFMSIQRGDDESLPIPTIKAISAVTHAYSMMTDNIWFDSWGNDLRDNDMDGNIDNSSEQGLNDGIHYHGGTRPYPAKVCHGISMARMLRTDQCPGFMQRNMDVYYKVCIDVPKESYAAAGISMPSTRSIRNIIPWFRRSGSFQTWTKPSLPRIMVPGDFIAVQSGGHSHSGIVPGFNIRPLVSAINLPGPTRRRNIGGQLTYWPSSTNDVFLTPWLDDIDFVARPIV